jgi:D-alanyl-D-alanine endopeptidase (penicillin-binding protein 7)
MLQLALMSSENRAAYALSTNFPGGRSGFVKAMNVKAQTLGLTHTHFSEPTGLMYQNKSTAEDLYTLVAAAYQYPEIRAATTTVDYSIYIDGNDFPTQYRNTNSLVRDGIMEIGLSKTGFINEAGRCVVMQTMMAGEPVVVVLLDAAGTNKRTGDVNRLNKWMSYNNDIVIAQEGDGLSPQLVMSNTIYETSP